jgi:hypothetical protein
VPARDRRHPVPACWLTDLGAAIAQKLEGFARPPGGRGWLSARTASSSAVVLAAVRLRSRLAATAATACRPTIVIQLREFTDHGGRPGRERVRALGLLPQPTAPCGRPATSADFFYSTSADSARLTRNFRLMLELVGLNGQVTFSGNRLVVSKVATR